MPLPVNTLLAQSPHYDRRSNPEAANDAQPLPRNAERSVAGHLLDDRYGHLWICLCCIPPAYLGGSDTYSPGHNFPTLAESTLCQSRWKQIRRRIWEAVREKYGYTHASMTVIE